MSNKSNNQKRIVMSMGGKGGGGKSTLMTSLVDFFHAENCPVTLIDCDTENKVHGSFSHFFKEALKVDITTPSGFDEFVEKVLCDNAPMVLADLGAGSGKFTFKRFDDMHDPLQEAGVRFLAIGVLTSEVATTETIFNWANALKSRTDYLIVRNHRNGDDFSALEQSEPGQRFLKVSKAPVIDMEARLDDIQRDLDKRGLSLRQALEAPSEIARPELANHLWAKPWKCSPTDFPVHSKVSLVRSIIPTGQARNAHWIRATRMTRASFGGHLPDSFKSEIFEYPDGTFDFRVEMHRPARRRITGLQVRALLGANQVPEPI